MGCFDYFQWAVSTLKSKTAGWESVHGGVLAQRDGLHGSQAGGVEAIGTFLPQARWVDAVGVLQSGAWRARRVRGGGVGVWRLRRGGHLLSECVGQALGALGRLVQRALSWRADRIRAGKRSPRLGEACHVSASLRSS